MQEKEIITGFTMIPNWIFTMGLSGNAIALLGYMMSKPNDWKFYRKNLKEAIKVSHDNTLSKYLDELIKSKLISKGKQENRNGNWGCVHYVINKKGIKFMTSDRDTKISSDRDTKIIAQSNTKLNNTIIKNIQKDNSFELDFSEEDTDIEVITPEKEIFNNWNRIAKLKQYLPSKRVFNDAVIKKINSRLQTFSEKSVWDEVFSKIETSKVLGVSDNLGWFSFDWLIKSDANIEKVLNNFVECFFKPSISVNKPTTSENEDTEWWNNQYKKQGIDYDEAK